MGVKKSSLQLLGKLVRKGQNYITFYSFQISPWLSGTSALFVASKFEEIYPPDVNEYAYITDNTYDKSQILFMEINILKVSSWTFANYPLH